jgi:type III secretion system low calcium response chaperone LcrH/SycD
MNQEEIEDRMTKLNELSPAAKEAVRRLMEKPSNGKEEIPHFAGLAGPSLDSLHELAYDFYHSGQYPQATSFFQVLTACDMLNQDYWMGLGAALLMNNEFPEALTAYGVACSLTSDDPLPHFYAAECQFQLSDRDKAVQALSVAEDLCTDGEAHRALLERITLLRQSWAEEE